MTSTTVTLRGVTKRYRSLAALDHVDLDLGPGITGLLGPNGAGKTTMLRVIATVLRPDDGEVRLLGRDPGEPAARTEVRRRLGYQPQELGFPRGFSAMAFVNYMAVLKEWADRDVRTREVRRVLDLVGLGDVATKRIGRLSGGQRRRVALAQSLLGTPELLVLDEPTTGLDPEQRASLRGVLADIAATSTMVISTHQTEDVAALCSRVIVLDAGRVHFDGTVPELVALAAGRVWMAAEPDAAAQASWRMASGRYRNVGEHVPAGAELVEPSLEDAYLLLRGASGATSSPSTSPSTSPASRPASVAGQSSDDPTISTEVAS
jgi:ABC-2 type transport system ATP-binding protein